MNFSFFTPVKTHFQILLNLIHVEIYYSFAKNYIFTSKILLKYRY